MSSGLRWYDASQHTSIHEIHLDGGVAEGTLWRHLRTISNKVNMWRWPVCMCEFVEVVKWVVNEKGYRDLEEQHALLVKAEGRESGSFFPSNRA